MDNHRAWARYWCSEGELHYWFDSVTGESEWKAWPWERHWCSECEMYYWFNTHTGESEWQDDDHGIPDAAPHHHNAKDEKEKEKDEQEDAEGEIW